jgi:hypothetical protein
VIAHQRERGLVERDLDRVPAARTERRHRTERRPHPRREIDEGYPDADARPLTLARYRHDARRGLDERVVARPAGERADRPEGRDRHVHELRVARPQRAGVEAALDREPRSQRLHDDLGAFGDQAHGLE